MVQAPKCKTCGSSLDEVPFDDCPEHDAWEEAQTALISDEILWDMHNELLACIYERTGDD